MCYTYEFKNVSICIGRDSIQKFNLKRCNKILTTYINDDIVCPVR